MQIKKSQNNKKYATSPLGWDTDQVQCPVRGLGPKCSITCQRPDEEHYFESIKLIFAQLYMDELTSWSGRGGGGEMGEGGFEAMKKGRDGILRAACSPYGSIA